jgi:hypothetical protein
VVATVGPSSRTRRKSVPEAVPARSFRSADERLFAVHNYSPRRDGAMKCLRLVCNSENKLEAMSESEFEAFANEHVGLGRTQ